jgi:Chalcone isomerase-like
MPSTPHAPPVSTAPILQPRRAQATGRRRFLAGWSLAAVIGWSGLAAAPAKAQVVVDGYTFARDLELGGQALRLNGVGLRAVAWVRGYAAGLYLSQRATTAAAVLADSGSKRLRLRMLLDVPAEEFVKAFNKGVARNTPAADMPALRDRMLQFSTLVQGVGKVRKGDVVDLDWLPGVGLSVSRNGQSLGAPLPGGDLYAALLRIFIGPRPVDPEMKAGLLGGPVG